MIGISNSTTPKPLRQPRVHSSDVGHLEGDEKANDESDEDEDDNAARPTWTRNEVHLIATEAPPWWALGRFFFGIFSWNFVVSLSVTCVSWFHS